MRTCGHQYSVPVFGLALTAQVGRGVLAVLRDGLDLAESWIATRTTAEPATFRLPSPLRSGGNYSEVRVVCSARVSQKEVSAVAIEPSAMARAVASRVTTVCLIR